MKTISKVSGKPTVISINGEEKNFGTVKNCNKHWQKLKNEGYTTPERSAATTNFQEYWA